MYLVDASAFMEANRLYYAFNIAPGFWCWLGDQSLDGVVASIDAVKDEITAGTGELVERARARPDTYWSTDTADVVSAMADLSAWAAESVRGYRHDAVDEFFDSADDQLIAHAIAIGGTVVTREQPRPESKKRVMIPEACNAFGVAWTDSFRMYRLLGMRLVS